MKKEFANKVIRERIVDTKAYRYTCKECQNANEQWLEIRRLPLVKLDTTAALSEWETVYDSRKA